MLSMWDYGGQKMFFTLHHMFLTPEGICGISIEFEVVLIIYQHIGVYLVVFNAQELVLGQTIVVDGSYVFCPIK